VTHARPGETRTSCRAFQLFPLELSLARGTLFTGRQTGADREKESDWSDVRRNRGGSVGIVIALRAGSRSCRCCILCNVHTISGAQLSPCLMHIGVSFLGKGPEADPSPVPKLGISGAVKPFKPPPPHQRAFMSGQVKF
jgi:hypothetical protein